VHLLSLKPGISPSLKKVSMSITKNKPADYSKYTTEQFIEELLAAQKSVADNIELAKAAETKAMHLQTTVNEIGAELESNQQIIAGFKTKISDLQTAIDEKVEQINILESSSLADKERIASLETLLESSKKKEANRREEFEFEGSKYEILGSAVHIPGLGKRTALEIVADETAQAKLVASGSGMIREIK
jgi:chromosome segregation ATPase